MLFPAPVLCFRCQVRAPDPRGLGPFHGFEKQRAPGDGTQLRDQVRRNRDFAGLFGTSPRMEEVKNTIEQVADTTATVLIRGESGTGKEVVARMIYAQSGRNDATNCASWFLSGVNLPLFWGRSSPN